MDSAMDSNEITDGTVNFGIQSIIPPELWVQRLQDKGKTENKIKKNYLGSKIPPIGPEGQERYYPDLFASAVDMAKNISQ